MVQVARTPPWPSGMMLPGNRLALFDELNCTVLSSILIIRLGGSRAAPRRQIKLTLTAAVEFPILQSINEGGGDSRAHSHL
jgi:hypothetical protein